MSEHFYELCFAEEIAQSIMLKIDEQLKALDLDQSNIRNTVFCSEVILDQQNIRWTVSLALDNGQILQVMHDGLFGDFEDGEHEFVKFLIQFYFWKYRGGYILYRPHTEHEILQCAKEYAVARQKFDCAANIRDIQDEIKKEKDDEEVARRAT